MLNMFKKKNYTEIFINFSRLPPVNVSKNFLHLLYARSKNLMTSEKEEKLLKIFSESNSFAKEKMY